MWKPVWMSLVKAGVRFKNSPNPFKSLALYKVVNPRTACFLTSSALLTNFTSKTHFGRVFQVPHGFLETVRCQGLTTTSSALETSGFWRRADFYWRVEPMMVGTGWGEFETTHAFLHHSHRQLPVMAGLLAEYSPSLWPAACDTWDRMYWSVKHD